MHYFDQPRLAIMYHTVVHDVHLAALSNHLHNITDSNGLNADPWCSQTFTSTAPLCPISLSLSAVLTVCALLQTSINTLTNHSFTCLLRRTITSPGTLSKQHTQTSGQNNLTQGHIMAVHRRFSRIRQVAPMRTHI